MLRDCAAQTTDCELNWTWSSSGCLIWTWRGGLGASDRCELVFKFGFAVPVPGIMTRAFYSASDSVTIADRLRFSVPYLEGLLLATVSVPLVPDSTSLPC